MKRPISTFMLIAAILSCGKNEDDGVQSYEIDPYGSAKCEVETVLGSSFGLCISWDSYPASRREEEGAKCNGGVLFGAGIFTNDEKCGVGSLGTCLWEFDKEKYPKAEGRIEYSAENVDPTTDLANREAAKTHCLDVQAINAFGVGETWHDAK